MSNSNTLDLPIGLIKKFMKQNGDPDMIISENVARDFGKSLRVFVHYLTTVTDDISKDRRKGVLTENDVKEALKEIGFDFLLENMEHKATQNKAKSAKRKFAQTDAGAKEVPSTLDEEKENPDDVSDGNEQEEIEKEEEILQQYEEEIENENNEEPEEEIMDSTIEK